MPTYKAIQREVRTTSGFVPKTCETAHVLELLGKKLRIAPKQAAIVEALRKLEGVRPRRSSL